MGFSLFEESITPSGANLKNALFWITYQIDA